jgi:hypothetical protein
MARTQSQFHEIQVSIHHSTHNLKIAKIKLKFSLRGFHVLKQTELKMCLSFVGVQSDNLKITFQFNASLVRQ